MSRKSELVAGRELDARVHAAIWKREVVMMQGQAYSRSSEGSWERLTIIPEYSTSIAAAWEVVEKMRELSWILEYDNIEKPGATFWEFGGSRGRWGRKYAEADTAPLAICLAAIQAVGVSRATKTSCAADIQTQRGRISRRRISTST